MKFPRNARIFRGQLDVAPFAMVFFLLVMFLMISSLVYTPGIRIPLDLPRADGLVGTEKPSLSVAIDAAGRLYFENQLIEENELKARLRHAVKSSPEPLALIIAADKAVTNEKLKSIALLARDAGILEAIDVVLPPSLSSPPERILP
jgi:biopolymer transport protein ExbD